MILRRENYYNFPELRPASLADFPREGFYLTFPFPKNLTEDTTLLEIPGTLTLRVMCRSMSEEAPDCWSMICEGCFYFKEEREWILEAKATMETRDQAAKEDFILRLPLSANFLEDGELVLWFDGVWLRFMQNGRILNENTGLDRFSMPNGAPVLAPGLENSFHIGIPGKPEITVTTREEPGNADFYSPADWNVYTGDVMNFYHDGVYHLLYLRDRRHHGSRNSRGGHDIYQLTSTDLKTWTEQPPVVDFDAPWQSCGTGTMIFHNGKYYMVYGLHTERHPSNQELVVPDLDPETGNVPIFSIAEILAQGKLPGGATCAVSEDGIHFEPTGLLFHGARNPSTYVMPDGRLRIYGKYRFRNGNSGPGVWDMDAIGEPVRLAEKDFNFVDQSLMKNTAECPSFFNWNGYQYLVVGFSGYYRTLSPDSDDFVDMAGKEEIYDGLCVPMVSKFGDDRYLMDGWIEAGWGSIIMHRELIQENGGRLGMKWVPEMVPETLEENLAADGKLTFEKGESYLLEMTVVPQNAAKFALQFTDGKETAEFQLNFQTKRMQTNDAQWGKFAEPIPTGYEQALQGVNCWATGNDTARNTHNYCLGGVDCIDKPFTLRVLIRQSKKLHATVLDFEVAGCRTMLSRREWFFPSQAQVMGEGAVIANLSLKKLCHPVK